MVCKEIANTQQFPPFQPLQPIINLQVSIKCNKIPSQKRKKRKGTQYLVYSFSSTRSSIPMFTREIWLLATIFWIWNRHLPWSWRKLSWKLGSASDSLVWPPFIRILYLVLSHSTFSTWRAEKRFACQLSVSILLIHNAASIVSRSTWWLSWQCLLVYLLCFMGVFPCPNERLLFPSLHHYPTT